MCEFLDSLHDHAGAHVLKHTCLYRGAFRWNKRVKIKWGCVGELRMCLSNVRYCTRQLTFREEKTELQISSDGDNSDFFF